MCDVSYGAPLLKIGKNQSLGFLSYCGSAWHQEGVYIGVVINKDYSFEFKDHDIIMSQNLNVKFNCNSPTNLRHQFGQTQVAAPQHP